VDHEEILQEASGMCRAGLRSDRFRLWHPGFRGLKIEIILNRLLEDSDWNSTGPTGRRHCGLVFPGLTSACPTPTTKALVGEPGRADSTLGYSRPLLRSGELCTRELCGVEFSRRRFVVLLGTGAEKPRRLLQTPSPNLR
jgi:hypothetical protein